MHALFFILIKWICCFCQSLQAYVMPTEGPCQQLQHLGKAQVNSLISNHH